MRFISEYIWQGNGSVDNGNSNKDTLMLQQVRLGQDSILLGCVCEEEDEPGLEGAEKQGRYFTACLMKWFYEKAIPLCGRGRSDRRIKEAFSEELERIKQELTEYGSKKGLFKRKELTFTGILAAGNRFWLFSKEGRAYLLNQSFRRSHIKRLLEGEDSKEIISGRLQQGLGILLCTDSFGKELSDRLLKEGLCAYDIKTEIQIERRLKELQEETLRQGGCEGSAIFIKTLSGE